MNTKTTTKKAPVKKATARKVRARRTPVKGLQGLTKAEQRKAIEKATAGATVTKVPASKLYYNKTGYNAIPSGYKGAYTIAAFLALGLIKVTGSLVTKGTKGATKGEMRDLLTPTAATTWTTGKDYATKGKDGKWTLTVNGVNNLSGRMDKMHQGRKLTSYGVDGIVDPKKALQQMTAFITKGARCKDAPDMVPAKVSDK